MIKHGVLRRDFGNDFFSVHLGRNTKINGKRYAAAQCYIHLRGLRFSSVVSNEGLKLAYWTYASTTFHRHWTFACWWFAPGQKLKHIFRPFRQGASTKPILRMSI